MRNQEILVVVPARGGSKGIPLKNLSTVGGESLISLVAKVINQLPMAHKAIVSTDHKDIADEAVRVGLEVPFLRPVELSGDRISDVDVLTHALKEMERGDRVYSWIVMLQPTSPLRKVQHVIDTINKLLTCKYDSVLTVSETDSKSHPLKQLRLESDRVRYFDDAGKAVVARQQLETLFHRNGIAYGMTRECLLDQKVVIGNICGSVLIHEPVISIDTPLDLAYANWLYTNKENLDSVI